MSIDIRQNKSYNYNVIWAIVKKNSYLNILFEFYSSSLYILSNYGDLQVFNKFLF